eukprot:s939_g6.t1
MREEVIKVNQNWAGSPGRLQLGLYKVEHIDMGSAGREVQLRGGFCETGEGVLRLSRCNALVPSQRWKRSGRCEGQCNVQNDLRFREGGCWEITGCSTAEEAEARHPEICAVGVNFGCKALPKTGAGGCEANGAWRFQGSQIHAVMDGKCLQVDLHDGRSVNVGSCTGQPHQQWEVDGALIRSLQQPGDCIDSGIPAPPPETTGRCLSDFVSKGCADWPNYDPDVVRKCSKEMRHRRTYNVEDPFAKGGYRERLAAPRARPDGTKSYKDFLPKFLCGASRFGWLGARHEFINDLVAAQWPYISDWFDETMRTNCEPALQSVMPAGITICFGDKCSLGTKPAQLQSIIASKYCEDSVEESTTIRLDAQLNYVGDSHVDVTCTVGSLVLTQLQVTGEIVIELVRLQKNPPWFSGVRIYFSNRPKIDLVVQTEVLGLNANFEFIKQKLVTALGDVIAGQAVLPNRFCLPIGDAISEVDLRMPTPQGVLRLIVLDPGLGDQRFLESHWSEIYQCPPSPAKPSLLIGLSPKWEYGNCFDFVVDDIKRQDSGVEFTVHDSDTSTFKWKADVLGHGQSKLSALLEGLWSIGPGNQSEWVLVADVLSATALPGDSNGQKHRVTLSLLWEGVETGQQSTTGLATAASPLALGEHMISTMNLRPEIGEVLRKHPERTGLPVNLQFVIQGLLFWDSGIDSLSDEVDVPAEHMPWTAERPTCSHTWRIYALWRAKVPMDQRAEKLERGYLFPNAQKTELISQACIRSPRGDYQPMFVDAVWNSTCHLLLDSIPKMTLRLAVSQHGASLPVGVAAYALDQLLEAPGWRFEGLLPLRRVGKVPIDPTDASAALEVRLRLHQLQSPPAHGAANAPATKLSRSGSQWFDAVGDRLRLSLTHSFSRMDASIPDEAPLSLEPPKSTSSPHFSAAPPPRRPPDLEHRNFRSRRFVPEAQIQRLGSDEMEFHEALEPVDSSETKTDAMDGGECFKALLRSVEEQYESDLHEVRCARRSKMWMNHASRRSFGVESQVEGSPRIAVQEVEEVQAKISLPHETAMRNRQSEPRLQMPEMPRSEAPRPSGRLSEPVWLKPKRASFAVQPRSSRRTSFADSRNERSDPESDEPQALPPGRRSQGSQRSSLRSSRSTEDGVKETEARNGFNAGRGRRTLFFDKSPEEMEAMFQEALNESEDSFGQYRGLDLGYTILYPRMTSKAEDLWPGGQEALTHIDKAFTIVFFLELFLRLLVYRLSFFLLALSFGLHWDVILAVVLRLVRLAKLARGLRVVRMARVMDSLHLLLKSIGASFSMLLWSMLLIGVIQCTAGMIIGYLVMDHLERDASQSEEVRHLIFRYYGTFSYTILTMFEVIFANWPIPCRVLVDHVDEWYSIFFIIYRCGVVGAVFVQQTMKLAADDNDLFLQQQTRAAEAYTRKIKDVFTKLDMSGEGYIYMEEFVEILNTPTMSHFMAKLELESTDLLSLFKLIDVDDSGQVSLEDFMTGCQRLKGPAKSVDLALLLAHTARLNCKVDNVLQLVGGETGIEDWGYGAAGDQKLEQRFLHSASTLRPGSTHGRDSQSTTSMDSVVSANKWLQYLVRCGQRPSQSAETWDVVRAATPKQILPARLYCEEPTEHMFSATEVHQQGPEMWRDRAPMQLPALLSGEREEDRHRYILQEQAQAASQPQADEDIIEPDKRGQSQASTRAETSQASRPNTAAAP